LKRVIGGLQGCLEGRLKYIYTTRRGVIERIEVPREKLENILCLTILFNGYEWRRKSKVSLEGCKRNIKRVAHIFLLLASTFFLSVTVLEQHQRNERFLKLSDEEEQRIAIQMLFEEEI